MKSKLQKLLKIYQNLKFCIFDSNVAQWECFLLKLQKIWCLSFIVTEIWPGQNTNSKSVFFWPKLPKKLAKLNFNFLLHNFSRYVILEIFSQIFCTKGSWRYGSDKESVTDKRTDGHTRRQKQYMSPAGGDI